MDCSTPGFPTHQPTPGACSNSCPLSRWCHSTISFPVVSFSSCLQSFLASESFPVRRLSHQSLCIRWPKYWSFSFSINPSNEYSELISFRIYWFDLATQGTLKSLHSSKATILQCSILLCNFTVIWSLLEKQTALEKMIIITKWFKQI